MATYALIEDFRDYSSEYADRPDAEIEQALLEAELDVDSYAGFYALGDNGLAFIPVDLGTLAQGALARATCAQAEYRLYMGPVFFIEQQQYKEVSGDVTTTSASRYGPKMKQEFQASGIPRRLTGAMR